MRRISTLTALALAAGLLAGCSTISVKSDWDPAFDFSSARTWAWAEVSQKQTGNPAIDDDTLFADRVRRAIERELDARGLRFEESGAADIEVAFFLVVEDKTSVTVINDYYGYGGGWGPQYGYRGGWGYGSGGFGSQTVVDQYKEGTLVIDLSQGEPSKLVWRGSGSARLAAEYTPEKSEARVNEAVGEILKRYPPPPAKAS